MNFSDLKLSRPLLRGIDELSYRTPTPVQSQAIPIALTGRDLLVNAMTGSGKTAAFMLPVLERLLYRPEVAQTRVLVLTPTRELAAQIYENTLKMAKFTNVTACLIVGGLSSQEQAMNLRNQPDIVVATPGRLIDHLHNTLSFAIEHVEILILDEADRLLESGFRDELEEIIRLAPRGRQSMLFSATLDKRVQDLASLSLNQPRVVSVDSYQSVVDNLSQEFIRLRGGIGKSSKAEKEAVETRREAITLSLCKRNFKKRVIIFVKSKVECHRLLLIFGLAKCRVGELHGNLTQAQRLEALDLFKAGEVDILICTDLAARGLDIPGVETVINMHLPKELRMYIHRVGRTARAGRSGRSISLAGPNDRKLLRSAVKRSKDQVKSRSVADKVIKKYIRIIDSFEEDIIEILREEQEDKSMRLAEMEANKAANMMAHEEEIFSRPAREWFQTPSERKAVKTATVKEYLGEAYVDPEEKKKKKKGRNKNKPEKPKSRAAQLKGLSRKDRRKKMAQFEDEDYAKEVAANPDLQSLDQTHGSGAVLKAKREKTRQDRTQAEASFKKVGDKAKRKKRKYSGAEREGVSRFEESKKQLEKDEQPTKKKKKTSAKSFKSKSRYKRR